MRAICPTSNVTKDGTAKAEFFARQLALRDDPGQLADSDPFAVRDQGPFVLLDDDGSALMIHRDPDDYEAGAARQHRPADRLRRGRTGMT